MQIIDNIPDLPLEPCVATIGFFDGGASGTPLSYRAGERTCKG